MAKFLCLFGALCLILEESRDGRGRRGNPARSHRATAAGAATGAESMSGVMQFKDDGGSPAGTEVEFIPGTTIPRPRNSVIRMAGHGMNDGVES
ncbi:hypothetical protein GCM10022254_19040 [Actinomadura meridiana]|uniref:Secreted protein n=1 Tax=Actinomadura meridiana TaxID=559626 RepID=A0ABP8BWI4_9ACTN